MNGLNYKIKVVDNFLNESDFKELCNQNLNKDFESEFKVYHNEINDHGIIKSSIDEGLLKKIHKNYFSKAMNILNEISPENQIIRVFRLYYYYYKEKIVNSQYMMIHQTNCYLV